jgi:conjugative relaxase-like TrwC/TraI family protein
MLSIGKLAAGPDAARYYEEAVGRGREDYYADEGETPGHWAADGAALLGLQGAVEDGQLGLLLAGEEPTTGALLGRPIAQGQVAGFDLTFKAPKSVSILFGVGEPELARALRECHETAVGEALGYLEREACRARRGHDGVVQVQGQGFVAAAFVHRTSRAGDPLLHTHVVVANRTHGPDGRWTALDARPLYRHAKTAGFVYQARLRREVGERLGLEWGEVRKGSAELAGFSRELIEHFSRRRAEIVEQLELRCAHSLAAGEAAAVATRKGKDYGVPIGRLREQWRTRAAEHGLDHERFRQVPRRGPRRSQPDAVDIGELTKTSSTFTRRDVLQALAMAHRQGALAAEIEREADALLAGRGVVRIAAPGQEIRYTTIAQVELERRLLETARARRDADVGRARDDLVEEAIERRRLSGEQAELVRSLTSSGVGVAVVRAPAGTGKTFALDAAREAWVRSGTEVMGCALSARAAAELREQAAIDATTIARLESAVDHGYLLPHRGVLVVDEAGMVGTRDLAKLADHAKERDMKLVLVGDDRQLPEIAAGGAFRVLAEREGAVELREVRRQRHPWDRDALNALRAGRTEDWARAYTERGLVMTAPTAPALRQRLATDWWQARERGNDALMVAQRRRDVADLNERGRERMRDAGRLGPDVEIGERRFATGDRVVLGRNDRRIDAMNGDRGEVLAASETQVDVKLDRGPEVRLPADYVQDHLDHGYAMTAHRVQGATVDATFVLGSDEAYREWGYTALSRHCDSARFYVNAPAPYLNRRAPDLSEQDELRDLIERTFDDSHRQELAIEAIARDPAAMRAVRELDDASERRREHQERLDALREQREQTPWYRRADRHDLDHAITGNEGLASRLSEQVDQLVEDVDRRISEPREPGRSELARDPVPEALPLGPVPTLDYDLGP